MINLRSGLNRYLQLPPNNRSINIMKNEVFQKTNKVFKGQLSKNKNDGLDVSKPIKYIPKQDIEKLYDTYFMPGLANGDTEILQHKVFFDLLYFTRR